MNVEKASQYALSGLTLITFIGASIASGGSIYVVVLPIAAVFAGVAGGGVIGVGIGKAEEMYDKYKRSSLNQPGRLSGDAGIFHRKKRRYVQLTEINDSHANSLMRR